MAVQWAERKNRAWLSVTMLTLDQALLRALNRGAANGVLDAVMPVITNLHQQRWFLAVALLAAIGLAVLGGRTGRLAVLCAIFAVTLADLTSYRIVKRIVPRERPCHTRAATGEMAFRETRLVVGPKCPGSLSFPSNHAANMMALGVVGWWFTRGKMRWLWFLLPLAIGYSRVYLGFHYPSDVLAGWLLGALCAAFSIWLGTWIVTVLVPALSECFCRRATPGREEDGGPQSAPEPNGAD